MDISALNDGYTADVPFGEDAVVTMRYLTLEESREISRKSRKRIWKDHQMAEEFDSTKSAILLGRAVVKGWSGITKDGAEYPYTPENCDFLMTHYNEFFRLVNETCGNMQAFVKKQQDETIKN